jgi:26S proteasome regulatory subunit N5
MERKEKTEFLLEQMRLLVAVARAKDQEAKELKAKGIKEAKGIVALDGEREWVKVRVGGRKVHEGFLAEKGNEELKLKYYQLMIQYALHGDSYLEAAKYFYKVWNTPSIKEDVDGKGREALENIAYYIVLAPYENEQSDMLNRLFTDPALERLELQYNLVKCFITRELMRWPGIENIYGPTLRKTAVFIKGDEGDKRWEDLHTRVIEHNIRVVSQYYTRITIARLTSLLDLTQKETEVILCKLVVSGSVYARIDRPAGIIDFRQKKTAEDIMNDWASDVSKLIGLVEKTWMGMNVALANKAASS